MQQVAGAPAAAPAPKARTWLGLDRFTLGIAAAVLLLVPVLFVLVLSQPRAIPVDASTPAGVVHNYYLAIIQDDLSTAYGYLSTETQGWLTYEQFTAQASNRPEMRGVRVQDERVENGTARVAVGVTLYVPTGPITSGEVSTQHTFVLRRQGDAWRIALPQPQNGQEYGPPGDLYGW